MKKHFAILMNLLFSLTLLKAQTVQTCEGNTAHVIIDADDALYFNLQGINLNAYDWTNLDVNCHINLMLAAHSSQKLNAIAGWTVIGLGATILPIGIIGDSPPLFVVSLGGIVGGIALISKSVKQKKEMNYHLNEVSKYFRETKLN